MSSNQLLYDNQQISRMSRDAMLNAMLNNCHVLSEDLTDVTQFYSSFSNCHPIPGYLAYVTQCHACFLAAVIQHREISLMERSVIHIYTAITQYHRFLLLSRSVTLLSTFPSLSSLLLTMGKDFGDCFKEIKIVFQVISIKTS